MPLPPGYTIVDKPSTLAAAATPAPAGYSAVHPPELESRIQAEVAHNKAQLARPPGDFLPQPDLSRTIPDEQRERQAAYAAERSAPGSVADPAGQGLGGLADEFAGLVGGVAGHFDPNMEGTTFQERYTGTRDAARDNLRAYTERNPGAALAAETATAALPISKGIQVARSAPGILPKIGAGVLTGVTEGGIFGFGQAEGSVADQADAAAWGAGFGGILSPLAVGIYPAFKYLKNRWAPGTPDDTIIQALKNDGFDLTSDEGVRAFNDRVQELGDQGTLADFGVNTRALTDTTQSKPGPGKTQINKFLDDRQAGRNQRVTAATYDELGDADTFLADFNEQVNKKRAQAENDYLVAYENPLVMNDKMTGYMSRPVIKDAYAEAIKLAQIEGRQLPDMSVIFPDGGEVKMVDTQTIDEVKRGLDTLIERNTDAVTGKVNSKARALISLKRELLSEVDAQNPAYKTARRNFSGNVALENAMNNGRRFMREDSEMLVSDLANMTPSEREFFSKGAAKAIRDRILSAQDGADAYKRLFNNETSRERIRAIMPDEQAFQRFKKQMERESAYAATRARVQGNSLTQERTQAARGRLDSGVGVAVIKEVTDILDDVAGRDADKTRQIANLLVNAEPGDVERLRQRALDMAPAHAKILQQAIESLSLAGVATGLSQPE